MHYFVLASFLAYLCTPPITAVAEQEINRADEAIELVSIDSQLVKGKPYSASSSTDTVQTLSDGNRIAHHTTSRVYRDSLGRTRREQTFGSVDPSNPGPREVKIFIDDPTGNAAFVLDPGSETALKLPRSRKFLDEGEANSIPRLHTLPPLDESRSIATRDLGTNTIDGLLCRGTRQTITIPAGQIGNLGPIVIVTETWYAPSIEAIVQSRTNDPRFGQTSYQLHDIQLGEQARALFELPGNYKLEHPRE
jgi:hypothetical protein